MIDNLVLTAYFNHLPDGQLRHVWPDNLDAVQPLVRSLESKGIQLRVFHTVSTPPPDSRTTQYISVKPIDGFSPNVARWFEYHLYLDDFNGFYRNVWMVDSTDVVCQIDPFPHMKKGKLYVGDEFGMKVDNGWMRTNQEPLIKGLKDYRKVIAANRGKTLVNCGLVGGDCKIIFNLLSNWVSLHRAHTRGVTKSTDMAIFNYLIWKHYSSDIVTGRQVNTVFKRNQPNTVSWWKHK